MKMQMHTNVTMMILLLHPNILNLYVSYKKGVLLIPNFHEHEVRGEEARKEFSQKWKSCFEFCCG